MQVVVRIAKQIDQRGFYGKLGMTYEPAETTSIHVRLDYDADWYHKGGLVDAAKRGVEMGLRWSGAEASCVIDSMHGHAVDTTPMIMTLAGLQAAWEAAGCYPEPELVQFIEECIPLSHRMTIEELQSWLDALKR